LRICRRSETGIGQAISSIQLPRLLWRRDIRVRLSSQIAKGTGENTEESLEGTVGMLDAAVGLASRLMTERYALGAP